MRASIPWIGLLLIVGGVWLHAAPPAEDTTGKEFVNDNQHKLVLQKADADSNLDLRTATAVRKHSFSMSGYLHLADEVDVAAISVAPVAVEASDEQGGSCLAPMNHPGKGQPETRYNPVFNHIGKFELRSLGITKAVSLLREIKLTFNLVVVERRTQVDVEAKVARDMTDAGAGLQFRIESLRSAPDGRTSVTVEYRRARPGPGAAILDTLTLLDGEGATLAVGRWTRGSPFEQQSKLTFDFERVDAAKARIARVGLVAAYNLQPTTFNLGNPYVE